jgi:hypothetical protein
MHDRIAIPRLGKDDYPPHQKGEERRAKRERFAVCMQKIRKGGFAPVHFWVGCNQLLDRHESLGIFAAVYV